jgi:Response regulator receiver domain
MAHPKNIGALVQLMRGEGFSPANGLAQKTHSTRDRNFEIMLKLRVLIVDDMALMRQGIKSLLEKRGNIEFVGEGSSGHEATHLAESLAPDVILMDQDLDHRARRGDGLREVISFSGSRRNWLCLERY